MPTAFGDGRTVQAAVADTREALVTAVAYMLEKGRTPPAPAREGNRSTQVNVRLTVEEKAVLESKAKAKGFRGLSDFIRASVLTERQAGAVETPETGNRSWPCAGSLRLELWR